MSAMVDRIFRDSSKMWYCQPVNSESPHHRLIDIRYALAMCRSVPDLILRYYAPCRSLAVIGCETTRNPLEPTGIRCRLVSVITRLPGDKRPGNASDDEQVHGCNSLRDAPSYLAFMLAGRHIPKFHHIFCVSLIELHYSK